MRKMEPGNWVARLFGRTEPPTAEEVKEIREEAAEELRAQGSELEAMLQGTCPLELIASLSAQHMLINSESFKEYLHTGDPFVVEFVTLLLLKKPYEFNASLVSARLAEITEFANLIKFATFFYHSLQFRSSPGGSLGDRKSAFENIQVSLATSDLFMRAPGYAHHIEQDVREVFCLSTPYLKNELGFAADDVVAFDHAFERLLGKREREIRRVEASWIKNSAWATDRSAQLIEEDDNESEAPKFTSELLKVLKRKGPSERRRALGRYAKDWSRRAIGRAHVFDSATLAAESGIPCEVADSIVRFFSAEFGTQEQEFAIFDTPHILFERPLVRHQDKFVYPVPGTVLWALRDRLEAVLNPDREPKSLGSKKIWKKYDDTRSKYLEREALELLGSTLAGSETYPGLKYQRYVEGKNCEFELDGLVIFDETLILVEAKAGTMSTKGRRGRAARMKGDLKKIVMDALEQGIRTMSYIEATDDPSFIKEDGSILKLDKSKFARTVLVTVSLDPLDVLYGSFHDFLQLGVLSNSVIPWPISLGSLRVICEMTEFPTQLLDYICKRTKAIKLEKIRAMDELDWFATYLTDGLRPEKSDEMAEVDMAMLDTAGSSLFDDYYSYKLGRRKKPASKPRQNIPELLKRLIGELEARTDASGRSEAIMALLDWDGEAREKMSRIFWTVLGKARHDGRMHDATLVANEEAGVTFFAVSNTSLEEGLSKLQGYVEFKKYQSKSRRWVGFLSNVDEQHLLHAVVICDFDWVFDEKAEAIIKMHEATN